MLYGLVTECPLASGIRQSTICVRITHKISEAKVTVGNIVHCLSIASLHNAI